MIHRSLITAIIIAAALSATPCSAQQFGQWTWRALFRAKGENFQRLTGDQKITDRRTMGFRLSLDLEGYIIHPAIAEFTLGLDTGLTNQTGVAIPDANNFGWNLQLGLFPMGALPTYLYYFDSQVDYDVASDPEGVETLPYLARSSRGWGGTFLAREGPITGLGIGVTHVENELEGRDSDDVRDRQYVSFRRANRKFTHNWVLERTEQNFATADTGAENYTLSINEIGSLGARWRLNAFGVGQLRSSESGSGVASESRRLSLRTSLNRDFTGGDFLQLSFAAATVGSSNSGDSWSQTVNALYNWIAAPQLIVAPSASYTLLGSRGDTAANMSAGGSVSWNTSIRKFNLGASASLFAGRTEPLDAESTVGVANFSGGLSMTINHGTPADLGKKLEIGYSRNELSPIGDDFDELPDFGARLFRVALQERTRARISLTRSRRRGSFQTYVDWNRRDANDLDGNAVLFSENWIFSFGYQWSTVSASLHGGSSFIVDPSETEQGESQRDYARGNISWRPWSYLSVGAYYQKAFNKNVLGPDIDVDNYGTYLTFQLGLFTLTAGYYEFVERRVDTPEQKNRGTTLSISRYFGGGLPFTSTVKRKGFIK